MNLNRIINWKILALVIGVLLVLNIIPNALSYYHFRYLSRSPMIPQGVMIQASKPYLVSTIASIIAAVASWMFYYYGKYKITLLVGLIAFIFEYANFQLFAGWWHD
jgi:hypothetical protein